MNDCSTSKERGGARLWPIALLLSLLIWVIATTDGRHVFVKEVLGDAFDSQAEHFLRGDVNVDGEAIRWEAMIVNGQSRMYFGPFPALLRIPLNLIYPKGHGAWSRISGSLAGELALFAFAGLISTALRASTLSSRAQNWLGGACLVGFVFATPLLFLLANLSIYNEAIIWGLAWSVAALFFAWRCRNAGAPGVIPFAGFSLCSAAAILSRLTYGAPFVLIAGLMMFQLIREKRFRLLAPLLIPLGIGVACYLLLSYARFGSFSGLSYDYYINPVHREFVHKYGVFRLARLPYSAADYFGLRFPAFQSQAPFLRAVRHPYAYPRFYSIPDSETYLPVTWTATWLLAGAIGGIVCLFQKNGATLFERGTAAAFACQSIGILSYHALSQRYSVDLYPFLIFCFVLFLRHGGRWLQPSAPILIALVALSGIVNSLATLSWLVGADQNVLPETHAIYDRFLGRSN